jgi:hypothetical protein
VVNAVVRISALCHFNRFARIHHHHSVSEVGDHSQVVRHKNHGHTQLALERDEQLQDLRLYGRVQGSGRFIGNQNLRFQSHCHGDQRPLTHTTGKLVRIFVYSLLRLRNPDQLKKFDRTSARELFIHLLVHPNTFGELPTHGVQRMQTRERVLKNQAYSAATDRAQFRLRARK